MKLVLIDNGYTTLRLPRVHWASLSRVCWFAAQESPDKEAAFWSLLGGLFHACAVAGFAQWHLGPAEAAVLAE